MNYRYKTNVVYFSKGEQKHLDEFIGRGIDVHDVIKNSKGEERKIVRLFYPAGLITKDTYYASGVLEDGVTKIYDTPSSEENGLKVIKIIYMEKDKMLDCLSTDFLKWLGSDYDKKYDKAPTLPNPQMKQLLATKKAQEKASTDNYKEDSKKAWTLKKKS